MDRKAELMARYPGYRWMIDRGLVGWDAFTALQPWYFVPADKMFYATEAWPNGPSDHPLLVFARRQDNDDCACFKDGAGIERAVVLIHGWAGQSYWYLREYPSFWDWLKSVVDDIAAWSDPARLARFHEGPTGRP